MAMLFRENWVTTVGEPVAVLVERLREHVTQERFFSKREGEFLFHGAVSEAGFSLIPVVVQVLVRSVKPWPVHISGEFEPSGDATTVRATLRADALVYWAAGLFVVALLGLLAYSIAIAPELTVAWLLMFVPLALLSVAFFWLYAWSRLRSSKRLLQSAIWGDKRLWPN
jgi:hypothetical protein